MRNCPPAVRLRMMMCWRSSGVLIHGRLDLSCPVDTAWELARAWPGAELLIDDHSGHRGSDTKRAWMLGALGRFASR
jgi:proline iminopeptidase